MRTTDLEKKHLIVSRPIAISSVLYSTRFLAGVVISLFGPKWLGSQLYCCFGVVATESQLEPRSKFNCLLANQCGGIVRWTHNFH